MLLGLCTLESVKKQTGPCQLPCHHCSSLLSMHRHCFSFHFPSGNLSCGFLLLGSKAKCWAFVLAEALLAYWLGFKHFLLDVVPLVFWNVCWKFTPWEGLFLLDLTLLCVPSGLQEGQPSVWCNCLVLTIK